MRWQAMHERSARTALLPVANTEYGWLNKDL
jgi:hypothetical protein